MGENILLERRDAVALITVNRPEKLNALNAAVFRELRETLEEVRRDDKVRVAVLTGAGDKAFAAGADIRELNRLSAAEAYAVSRRGQAVFDLLENLGKVSIAAVNGFALGGGCELALAATIRVAAGNARFGFPEVTLGLIPGYAGTQRLPRLVGKGRALELITSGLPVDAQEAYRLGLANLVIPAWKTDAQGEPELDAKGRRQLDRELFLEEVFKYAQRFLKPSGQAIATALQVVNRGLDLGLSEAQLLESTYFGLAFDTEDMREGTAAFLEKRAPRFKH